MLVPCNWKVTAEAFLEVYHFKHIHSHDGVSVLDNRGAAMGLYPGGHSRMITPYSQQNCDRNGMADWSDWKALDHGPFPTIDTVPDMVDCTSTAVSLFPNIIIPLGKFGFPINIFWPVDKGTTLLEWIYYAPKDWEGDELPEHWEIRRKQYNQIMDEDMMNMAPMQRSLESPALSGHPDQLPGAPDLASPRDHRRHDRRREHPRGLAGAVAARAVPGALSRPAIPPAPKPVAPAARFGAGTMSAGCNRRSGHRRRGSRSCGPDSTAARTHRARSAAAHWG